MDRHIELVLRCNGRSVTVGFDAADLGDSHKELLLLDELDFAIQSLLTQPREMTSEELLEVAG